MRARGGGFFLAGSIGMIVVGLIHAAAHLRPRPAGAAAAIEAMRAFSVTALGFTWNIEDAYGALSLSYSALSILVGAIGIAVQRLLRPDARALRSLAALFALGAATLVAIAAAHHVAPPIYFYSLVAALFACCAALARPAA